MPGTMVGLALREPPVTFRIQRTAPTKMCHCSEWCPNRRANSRWRSCFIFRKDGRFRTCAGSVPRWSSFGSIKCQCPATPWNL